MSTQDNMTKKVAYIMLSIGIVLVISGAFSSFLNGLKKDRELVVRRMEDVSSSYETFSTSVSLYGDYREDFHESILENLYYETMYATDSFTRQELKKYESMVDDITAQVDTLEVLCKDVYYPDGSINSMCMNYRTMYEQVVNFFVSDIENYNEVVNKFNNYQTSINSSNLVKEYTTTKNYIDYNGDHIIEGKEE